MISGRKASKIIQAIIKYVLLPTEAVHTAYHSANRHVGVVERMHGTRGTSMACFCIEGQVLGRETTGTSKLSDSTQYYNSNQFPIQRSQLPFVVNLPPISHRFCQPFHKPYPSYISAHLSSYSIYTFTIYCNSFPAYHTPGNCLSLASIVSN